MPDIVAFPGYKSNEPLQLEAAGIPFTLFDPADDDIPGSFGVIYTNATFLDRAPDRGRRTSCGRRCAACAEAIDDPDGRGADRRRAASTPAATRCSCRPRARPPAGGSSRGSSPSRRRRRTRSACPTGRPAGEGGHHVRGDRRVRRDRAGHHTMRRRRPAGGVYDDDRHAHLARPSDAGDRQLRSAGEHVRACRCRASAAAISASIPSNLRSLRRKCANSTRARSP